MNGDIAVVIAAGPGSRLLPFTAEIPKSMLKVQGKPILSRALETFRNVGIPKSVVVGGYRADGLAIPADSRLVLNDRYESNNILHSLAYARSEMDRAERIIVSYSDIIFRQSVVEQLMGADDADIVIVVDQAWKERYDGRTQHPLSQAEAAEFDDRQRLRKTGKDLLTSACESRRWGEFIGMLKLTRRGNKLFWDTFDEIDARLSPEDPFRQTATWRTAYLTDLIQELVDRGVDVRCTLIQGGYVEIDTPQDYEFAGSFRFSSDARQMASC